MLVEHINYTNVYVLHIVELGGGVVNADARLHCLAEVKIFFLVVRVKK